MSAHCFHPWNWDSEPPKEFIEQIASCINYHLQQGWFTWPVFAILTNGDQFVHNIGGKLALHKEETTVENFDFSNSQLTEEQIVLAKQIIEGVLPLVMEETKNLVARQQKIKETAKDKFKTLNFPKVKKPFPKL